MTSTSSAVPGMPATISLSFCIPTYNRSASVLRLVSDILSCPDQDIDVVVLDNGSPDDTLAALGAIVDSRLKVSGNSQNRGALFNMVNVLSQGDGEYLVYSTDQDSVDPRMIPLFKSFLTSHPTIACGYCTFYSQPDAPPEFFARGFECVKAIAYKGRHPTGYFFRKEHLQAIRFLEKFSDFDIVDLFPLDFAFAELGLLGEGAIYHQKLFTPETGPAVAKRKSATTNGTSRNAFFAPAARLKLAVSYSRHVQQLKLSAADRSKLTAQIFVDGLRSATAGYKAMLGNPRLCAHYGMDTRNVSQLEQARIAIVFFFSYLRQVFARKIIQILPFMASVVTAVLEKIAARSRSNMI